MVESAACRSLPRLGVCYDSESAAFLESAADQTLLTSPSGVDAYEAQHSSVDGNTSGADVVSSHHLFTW